MGETSNNKYQKNCLEKPKNNYKKLLLYSDKGQSSRREWLINSLKDATSRQTELEKKKKETQETLFQNNLSKILTRKMPPYFLGKKSYIK